MRYGRVLTTHSFWGIFFIDASSTDTADQGFLTIAQRCGLGDNADVVKRWLANIDKPWLLILDNADDPSLDISKYFPTGGRGTILITTRNPECTTHGTIGSEEIGAMAIDEAIILLLRTSEKEDLGQTIWELAKPVVETLGCLALAIVHAGALIKKGLYSLENYCEAYSRNRQRLFGHQTTHANNDYKYTVYTTWEISVEMIRKSSIRNANNSDGISSETAKNALELLNFFGFLHFDDIPVKILENAWKNQYLDDSSSAFSETENAQSHWTDSHQLRVLCQEDAEHWDPVPSGEAIALLSSFSLIRFSHSNKRISLHPLVHTWIRDRLTEAERAGCSLTTALTLSKSVSILDRQYERALVPHINSCLELIGDSLFTEGEGTSERLWIVYYLAAAYIGSGHPKQAFRIILRALEICEKTFSVDEDLYLNIEERLALTYSALGDDQKAVEHQEKVLQIRMRPEKTDKEHPETLQAMSQLGVFYNGVGRYRDALELYQKVANASSIVLGDEHPITLDLMGGLATTYYCLGQHQEALELQEVNVQGRKRLFSKEDLVTLKEVDKLAQIYNRLGRSKESLKLNEEVLQSTQKLLGDEHPDTLTFMGNLASSYSNVGRVLEALKLREKVLVLSQKILGNEHPDTLILMSDLARSYSDVDRMQEALDLNEKVLMLQQKILGDEHPNTLTSMSYLALRYSDVDRMQESLNLKEEVLVLHQKILDHEHPDILVSMSNLASSYLDVGRMQEALDLQKEVLVLHQKILGDEHPNTLQSMRNLAVCYAEAGRSQEALELLVKAVEGSRRTLGEDHPDTLELKRWLDDMMNGPKLSTGGDGTSSSDVGVTGPEESTGRRGFRGWLRRLYPSKS